MSPSSTHRSWSRIWMRASSARSSSTASDSVVAGRSRSSPGYRLRQAAGGSRAARDRTRRGPRPPIRRPLSPEPRRPRDTGPRSRPRGEAGSTRREPPTGRPRRGADRVLNAFRMAPPPRWPAGTQRSGPRRSATDERRLRGGRRRRRSSGGLGGTDPRQPTATVPSSARTCSAASCTGSRRRSCAASSTSVRNASTTAGSNWVPAPARSSRQAAS
jgi:hypothetical protein